jgi:transcriptional regulator GlxA family with amidase domain
MAGGGTSWQDMALYRIARHVGLKEARQVARTYMLDFRQDIASTTAE